MWTSRIATFNPDRFPQAERGPGSGLHDVGATEFADDGEEMLAVIQEDAAEPAADEVGDSTLDFFNPATEDAPETEVLQTTTLSNSTIASTFPRRDRRPPLGFATLWGRRVENVVQHCEALAVSEVSETAEEALGDRNWRRAMQREYDSLMMNQVWTLVPWPSGRQPITRKWHFALKMDFQEQISKYKARFGTRGFFQAPTVPRNICSDC